MLALRPARQRETCYLSFSLSFPPFLSLRFDGRECRGQRRSVSHGPPGYGLSSFFSAGAVSRAWPGSFLNQLVALFHMPRILFAPPGFSISLETFSISFSRSA